MATSNVSPTNQAAPEPVVAAPGPVAQDAREALYQRLGYNTPVAEAAPADTAAAGPGDASPAPAPVDVQRQILEAVQAAIGPLAQRLAGLETRQAPPAAAAAPAEPTKEKTWVEYLKEGNAEGFEAALIRSVEAKLGPSLTQHATDESVARSHAEIEVRAYNDAVRARNPDLADVEDWVEAVAKRRLDADMAAGKLTDYSSTISSYKAAVDAAVEDVRKRIRGYVATGKDQGLTVRQEVLATGAVRPDSTTASRGQNGAAQAPPDVSPQNYLSARLAQSARRHGMAPLP